MNKNSEHPKPGAHKMFGATLKQVFPVMINQIVA